MTLLGSTGPDSNSEILGFLLMGKEGADTIYFGPWHTKGGNKAVCGRNVINTNGLNTFKVSVQTKKFDEDDAQATDVTTDQSITLTASTTTTWSSGAEIGSAGTGFKDQWRFKYKLNVTGGSGKDGWVHCRPTAPSWLTE